MEMKHVARCIVLCQKAIDTISTQEKTFENCYKLLEYRLELEYYIGYFTCLKDIKKGA